jgi:hypothetical protein
VRGHIVGMPFGCLDELAGERQFLGGRMPLAAAAMPMAPHLIYQIQQSFIESIRVVHILILVAALAKILGARRQGARA